jgi:CHAD domain-containing protein
MRVAARRMRAALRLFKDVLPPEANALNDELKWVAVQLGQVRDLDVQLMRVRDVGAKLGVSDALVPYETWLDGQRQSAHRALKEALRSKRFSELVQRFPKVSTEWLANATNDAPLAEDAPRRLRRAYKALKKRAEPLDARSPAPDLHVVRIRAKRLRYAAEFLEPRYGKPSQRVVKRATALQDLLGELQDDTVGNQRIHEAIEANASSWLAATSLALGRVLQHDLQRAKRLRGRFKKTYVRVKEGWQRLRRDLRRPRQTSPSSEPLAQSPHIAP